MSDQVDFEGGPDGEVGTTPAAVAAVTKTNVRRRKDAGAPVQAGGEADPERWVAATLLEAGDVRENPLPVSVNGTTALFPYGEKVMAPYYMVRAAEEAFQEGQKVKLDDRGKQVAEFNRRHYQFRIDELPVGKQNTAGAAEYARANGLRFALQAV